MKKISAALVSILLIAITIVFAASLLNYINSRNSEPFTEYPLTGNFDSTKEPTFKISTVLTGLSNPWDLTFINNNFFYYSERIGQIRGHNNATNEDFLLIRPDNVYVTGEAGMLSIQKDVDFENNHYLYNCMDIQDGGSTAAVNITRWKVSDDLKTIIDSKVIISDMPANESGRHSGCRIVTSSDGTIWIGTGDTANGVLPQDPNSLGGKILRVDREGKGVAGNLPAPFDSRIFSYGHRNVQGITLFPEPINGVYGLTAEHGPDKDDEVNLLKSGNFGWNPVGQDTFYNESVPMTDLTKYPDAIPAVWSSGDPTVAISGMTILRGKRWQAWEGDVLVAVLKDMHIRLQKYDSNWKILRDDKIFTGYGRIRTVVEGLDGDLYIATDNGGGSDVILRVTPE